MRCNRSVNNNIADCMSEVCALCYKVKKSNFGELFERGGFVSIHHCNIQFLAIEMFKVFKGVSPQIVTEISV